MKAEIVGIDGQHRPHLSGHVGHILCCPGRKRRRQSRAELNRESQLHPHQHDRRAMHFHFADLNIQAPVMIAGSVLGIPGLHGRRGCRFLRPGKIQKVRLRQRLTGHEQAQHQHQPYTHSTTSFLYAKGKDTGPVSFPIAFSGDYIMPRYSALISSTLVSLGLPGRQASA